MSQRRQLEPFTHLSAMSPTKPNVYFFEARLIRDRILDNTSSCLDKLTEMFEQHGRYSYAMKYLHLQSIIHVSDFPEVTRPIEQPEEYYGVIFLSNMSNGTEIYFKPSPKARLSGPYPWFRGNITLPIEKLMEVGEEMISYPKINRQIGGFLKEFDNLFFGLRNSGEVRSGASRYFDARYRAEYQRPPEYRRSKSGIDDLAVVFQDTSHPYGR